MARRVREEDGYRGYRIPKGTIVLPNIGAISRLPHSKYSPEDFVPERFLDLDEHVIDPSTYVFGFGRRVCPGKLLAEKTVFIVVCHLLTTFKLEKLSEIPKPWFKTTGLSSYPNPFPCSFKLRCKGVGAEHTNHESR